MKKFGLLLFLFSIPLKLLSQEQMANINSSENDIVFLQEYFKSTFENLQQETMGLSTAQLQFKPSEKKWSVSQCLEHIIKTEKMLFGVANGVMSKPANPEKSLEVKITNEQIMAGIESRNKKFKAPAELQPMGMYKDSETALNDLHEQRKQILDYLSRISSEELGNHISNSSFGLINGYQSMLYIPGHTARHTSQIKEIKASPDFPKE